MLFTTVNNTVHTIRYSIIYAAVFTHPCTYLYIILFFCTSG